jgi:hypothetical protein
MTLSERALASPTVSFGEFLSGTGLPLDGLAEVRLADYAHEIVASGFPGMRSLGARALKFQLNSYPRNAVDRDMPGQELAVRKPDAMLGWGGYEDSTIIDQRLRQHLPANPASTQCTVVSIRYHLGSWE